MINIVSRQELWHPLSVHLPIVFLLSATVLSIVLLCLKKNQWYIFIKYTLIFLLTSGTAFLWLSFYTGNQAYGPVVRTICYPSLLKTHLYWAYVTCYSFSAISLFAVIGLFVPWLQRKIMIAFIAVGCVLASACLCYTGHLGGTLVYEHGAGVNPKAKDCAED
ncbi:DUF2231 domain-containing protein [Pseudopedobacter sp.]|uniref:DUF2231 domain-containing protein n=1 Tax=Pseudopedobacter sp. TaxID=1936787 RepID=UPI00333ED7D3